MASCIACHHVDPALEGTLGPEVKGASQELLEARLLRAEYPKNYKPKRNTKLMTIMPHTKEDIAALAEYLSAPSP